MDYGNDNEPIRFLRSRVNYPLLGLAVLISLVIWFVIGLTLWRAFRG